jgi:hypothetical protein
VTNLTLQTGRKSTNCMFGKPKALVQLKRDRLGILKIGEMQPMEFIFPKDSVKDLDIIDSKTFTTSLRQFLNSLEIKPGKYLLLLTPDLLFQKVTTAKKPEELQKRIQAFLDGIPFIPEKLVYKLFEAPKGKLAVATNHDFFSVISQVFKQSGWKTIAVVPDFIFGKGTLTTDKIKEIAKDKKLIQNSDFLHLEPQITVKETQEEETKEKPAKKIFKKALVFLGIVSILGGFGFILYRISPGLLNLVKNGSPKDSAITTTDASETPSFIQFADEVETNKVATTVEEDINKEDVSIQILNGTGVAGLAGATAKTLEEAGYANTSVGNAATQGQAETVVQYSSEITQEMLSELTNILGTRFARVNTTTHSSEIEPDYMIIITTGTVLTQ